MMVVAGWKRKTVNERVIDLRAIVRWGVENEIIPATILHALEAVKWLRQGDSDAPESKQVIRCQQFASGLFLELLHVPTQKTYRTTVAWRNSAWSLALEV